jgi:hypothetical protein
MLNLTLGVPSQASKSVKLSIRPMLMSYIALVESKKDYITARDITARDITARDITARDITARKPHHGCKFASIK